LEILSFVSNNLPNFEYKIVNKFKYLRCLFFHDNALPSFAIDELDLPNLRYFCLSDNLKAFLLLGPDISKLKNLETVVYCKRLNMSSIEKNAFKYHRITVDELKEYLNIAKEFSDCIEEIEVIYSQKWFTKGQVNLSLNNNTTLEKLQSILELATCLNINLDTLHGPLDISRNTLNIFSDEFKKYKDWQNAQSIFLSGANTFTSSSSRKHSLTVNDETPYKNTSTKRQRTRQY